MAIYVTQSSMPDLEDYIKEIKPIFESRVLTNMGPVSYTHLDVYKRQVIMGQQIMKDFIKFADRFSMVLQNNLSPAQSLREVLCLDKELWSTKMY